MNKPKIFEEVKEYNKDKIVDTIRYINNRVEFRDKNCNVIGCIDKYQNCLEWYKKYNKNHMSIYFITNNGYEQCHYSKKHIIIRPDEIKNG